jgi:hypothetical protein
MGNQGLALGSPLHLAVMVAAMLAVMAAAMMLLH